VIKVIKVIRVIRVIKVMKVVRFTWLSALIASRMLAPTVVLPGHHITHM
jgi:hypothetical protein